MSVTAIGKVNFDKEVLQSEIPVLVDLSGPLVRILPETQSGY